MFSVGPNDHKHKELEWIEKEKDLGVIFDNNMKFSSHIMNQVNKANRLMGLTRWTYTYLDKNSFRYLFNGLVRPHLEYGVSIWYPLLKRARGADWKCILSCIKVNTRNIKFFICWSSSCYRYTKHEISSDQRWHESSLQNSPRWRWITKSVVQCR